MNIIDLGGNTSEVFRKGNKVCRKQKKNSKTVQRLLVHLKNCGFEFSPVFFGTEGDYEILSYIEGVCYEPEEYPFTAERKIQLGIIKRMAGILRKFHDCTASFICTSDDEWWLSYNGKYEKEVICHNDVATYNVTFKDDMPCGIIDFDTCCPAPRIWDIAYAVYRFVPLQEEFYDAEADAVRKYNSEKDAEFRKIAIKAFFEEYGMDMPNDFSEAVTERLTAMADLILTEADKGNEDFVRMLDEGHRDFYLGEAEFIAKHFNEWR